MVFLLIFCVAICIIVLVENTDKTFVVKCNSFTCKHNSKGKCSKREIQVYDNSVAGLCLWHSEPMDKRILEPLLRGIEIGKKSGQVELLDKLLKENQEAKLWKDPNEFKKWIERHYK